MQVIPLSRPNISEENIEQVAAVIRTGMLVQGKHVELLEQKVGKYLNAPSVAAVSNGTATMHLALKILGIGPGDEVIVPAFSYVATANVVELVGAKTVFVDIEDGTNNIDVRLIESKITTKTKCIIPVHEFGLCADMNEILSIAQKHQLFVIEDAACALGATYDGKKSGTMGDFGSFSLHPRKAVTSGEGGLLVSKQAQHDQQVRILRNHGISIENGKMNFVQAGFNYRMTDFQAALVLGQVDAIDQMIAYRKEIAQIYFERLNHPLIQLPKVPDGCKHAWQSFHIILDNQINRDELIEYLKGQGIGSNYGAQCIPAMTYYQNTYGGDALKDYPNAYKAYKQGLVIPMYDTITREEAYHVTDILLKAISR